MKERSKELETVAKTILAEFEKLEMNYTEIDAILRFIQESVTAAAGNNKYKVLKEE